MLLSFIPNLPYFVLMTGMTDTFTEYEFYHTISDLSYSGDFRMTFGENKNKVQNIVKAQLPGFRQLYRPFILSLPDYVDFPVLKEEELTKLYTLFRAPVDLNEERGPNSLIALKS
ncbi:hypothetical protein NQ315_016310 [Exocentrus adspersus]|uniref:Phosphatidate cytidylyltransferase, mitochondrial n=1 Tax=Exocentrus adspersus TaxID=1586481 RepID=A0AAV8VP29_9CUCU|nr:hypothetical protein NQ315_016310 [Exocentrus adspersus]